jgi:interferon gamma inducible protein 47
LQRAYSVFTGVGTENFPRVTYLRQVNYEKYDFFLIICKSRFTEDDIWLAQEVVRQKKSFFFVRTQVDVDLTNAQRDHSRSFNEIAELNQLKSDCTNQFLTVKENGDVPSVYAISGLLAFNQKWDFPRLMNDLLAQYPDLKRHAMILAMSSNCSQVIQTKVNELKQRKWVVATLSAGIAAIPLPCISAGFDLTACTMEAEFYRDQLGLSKTNLRKLADIHKIPLEHFNQELHSILPESLFPMILQIAKSLVAVSVGEEASRFIPLVGSVIASALSFGSTLFILDNMLNRMEEAAMKMNNLIASSSQVF